jgi:hypothetical protein
MVVSNTIQRHNCRLSDKQPRLLRVRKAAARGLLITCGGRRLYLATFPLLSIACFFRDVSSYDATLTFGGTE